MLPKRFRDLLLVATAGFLLAGVGYLAYAPAVGATDWMSGASQYGGNQDWQGLQAYGQRWTQAEPKNPLAWATLGDAYCRLGQLDQTAEAFKKAAALTPTDSRPLEALSGCYANAKQFEKAAEVMQTAVKVAPNNGRVWLGFGTQLHNLATQQQFAARSLVGGALPSQTKKNFEDSAEAYKRALQLNAGDPKEMWTEIGSDYYYALDYIPAMKAYMSALQIDPHYSYALNGLALCNGAMKTQCTRITGRNATGYGADVIKKIWVCDAPTTAFIHQADSLVAGGSE
ncbi:tetratricopeptide repeat protein [Candidatus Binatus soli]|jgi:tetratricopeptide (TPR) repeat protein|uniref:tetratricopeptide repeat protein n=1 Tax=Candidatus Binatus soli TaxID=1953413 RepID=UPI003D13C29A